MAHGPAERETLAVVWACEHFHLYIFGKHVTIYTDHKPLVSIYGNPNSKPPARIKRWSLRLQSYDISIIFRAGSGNPADYLSRHSTHTSSKSEKIAEEYITFIIVFH